MVRSTVIRHMPNNGRSEVYDQAVEWVSEWHPNLEGEAFEAKLQETIQNLEEIDAQVLTPSSFSRSIVA